MKCKNEKKKNTSSRREFVKTLSGAAASAFLFGSCSMDADSSDNGNNNETSQVYGPRTGAANPYVTSDGRPILVSVTGTSFAAMLTAGLEAIGGLNKLINNNQDVLINAKYAAARRRIRAGNFKLKPGGNY